MTYHFHRDGTLPTIRPGMIFVFGSNEAGQHGKGAAKVAVEKFGAIRGQGEGRQGNSYAIPTCNIRQRADRRWDTIPLGFETVADNIAWFVRNAEKADPNRFAFFVTRIGCGLAGFNDARIAPLFKGVKGKFSFAEEWRNYL